MSLAAKRLLQQVLPKKLRNAWWRYRTHGLWSALKWLWCQSFTRTTGIPVLSDGRITRLVYIGPQHGHLGKWRLRLAGIRHIINLRSEFNDAKHHLALENYCYLPTPDHTAPSVEHLWEGVAFIHRAVAQGDKVYVHCKRGQGRAPTLGAAYLISHGLTVHQALECLQQVRPSAGLNQSQRAQLEVFAGDCEPLDSGLVTTGPAGPGETMRSNTQ